VAALLIPGAGWLFLAFFQAVLLLWLVACLAGIFVAARFYRRMRRDWWSGHNHYRQGWPGGYSHHQYGYWRS
jgi:membrane protein implicated in regulation of membrane protease activity